ncbi:MAG: acetyl-CoA decarbonylase/synthase complex subunit gamma [Candidatus Bathyarchaeia archaeon]|nr:acetyl-CoA decarbonylase/synthase complex subunit gamma [Candidatus Bathyarchaeota archaeon]
MGEKEIKKSIRELSPLDIYMLLPRTNCGKCGEKNCMAFATKVVNREVPIEQCAPLIEEDKYKSEYTRLREILAPAVKEIVIGVGENAVKVGGKLVMYRHEFTYYNPTPIAIDVTDEMPENEILERVRGVESFTYNYIGRTLKLDMIAIRSTSNNPDKFKSAVEIVAKTTKLPLILCTFNPEVMKAALELVYERRPLIYAATERNWKQMAELALMYNCPLTVFAQNNIELLKSLVKTLLEYGVEDLLLDPGTFPENGLSETITNFTMIRRSACKGDDRLLGYPLVGVPMTVWLRRDAPKEVLQWKEACLAALLMARYADLLIMHSLEGWVLLPNVVLRFNLYTDPRKPVSVEPGLKIFGNPNEGSPVMFTTNYALTYFTVESDIKSANIDCYLIVVDTGGISVESSVAGRILTAQTVADAIKKSGIEEKVKHRYLIIPGLAARLSGEIEELSGWRVLVGPRDSSGIPAFLKDKWPPKET